MSNQSTFTFTLVFICLLGTYVSADTTFTDYETRRLFTRPKSCLKVSPKTQLVYVEHGDTLVLKCQAYQPHAGLTVKQVFWKGDKQPVYTNSFKLPRLTLLDDYTFVLKNASLFDSKTYTCVTLWKNSRGIPCIVESVVIALVMRKLHEPLEQRCGKPWNVTFPTKVPWMAMLFSQNGDRPICGGSLISNQWILTASHCLDQYPSRHRDDFKNEIVIRLGSNTWNGQVFEIDEVFRHGQSGGASKYDKDLLLIRLKQKITYDDDIWPICLPEDGQLEIGELGMMTGWGATSPNGGPSSYIKKLQLPIRSRRLCRDTIQAGHTFTDNMFCAGHGDGSQDQCNGDSGGPFAVLSPSGRWTLAGVVSFGETCSGLRSQYGYYARVGELRDWIRKTVFDKNTFTSPSDGTDCEYGDYGCGYESNDGFDLYDPSYHGTRY